MRGPLLASYRLLATSDPDEGQEFAGRVWEKHHRVIRRGQYGLSWHQATLSRSSLVYVETRCAELTSCAGPQAEVFRFGMHESGRIEHRINGKPAISMPGQGVLHAPRQDVRFESEPFGMLFLALPADTVQAALNSRFTSVPPFETWATEFPLDTSAAAALASLCLWTAGELERPGSFLLSAPRAMASLERTVLAFFVEALEERYPGIDRATPDLAEKQVRMIEEWMDAHLTDIVGVEELAAVVGTVPRSVQRTFRRLRGCTPMQAFLRRRLELAKRLLEDRILDRTVTDVATECGFFHLGRFSGRYRALFGETPSATLARRRRRSTRA